MTAITLLLTLVLQDAAPQPQPTPQPESKPTQPQDQPKPSDKPQEPPTASSEPLKTLIDKVRERVTRCEEALKASGTVLVDFEAEITGKVLSQINFKQLANNVGTARASIKEALKDADLLMRRLDKEIMESMKEEEKLLFRDGTKEIDSEKAGRLTETIRTVLQIHEVLPGDTLAKTTLEMLAESIDKAMSPGGSADELLDISSISADIVRAIMLYRRSLNDSVDNLGTLETILTVLENKSRDLSNLISKEGDAPDKGATARVQALVKEINENRDKAISIFKRIGRKIKDTKKPEGTPGTPDAGKSKIEELRDKYLKDPPK